MCFLFFSAMFKFISALPILIPDKFTEDEMNLSQGSGTVRCGKVNTRARGILRILGWTAPDMLEKYKHEIMDAGSLGELESLEQRIGEELAC